VWYEFEYDFEFCTSVENADRYLSFKLTSGLALYLSALYLSFVLRNVLSVVLGNGWFGAVLHNFEYHLTTIQYLTTILELI
jgi:hypothetical protein